MSELLGIARCKFHEGRKPPTDWPFVSCSTPTPVVQIVATREGRQALFTADTRFSVYMDRPGTEPSSVLEGRAALAPVFDDLNRYEVTMHFNGQSTVRIDGDRASGDSYTIAHHVFTEAGSRQMMVAWLRYLDIFAKVDENWFIADRQIILEWSETRPLGAPAPG